MEKDPHYTDEKGRTRWRKNDEIGARLKQLGEFLVIGGYPEDHAARYPKLAHDVSRYPESVVRLTEEGRLDDIPGIGETISTIITELVQRGSCTKWEEWAKHTPESVVELTAIPGLGAKMAKLLYQEHGIADLKSLGKALEAGKLDKVPGLGKKTVAAIRDHIAKHDG